jgi:hypothetical protein
LASQDIDVTKEVDFSIIKEDWARYKLTDGTILRVRIGNLKLIPTEISEIGTPNFAGTSLNLISALVPKELLDKNGPPLPGDKITPEVIKDGTEVDFEMIGKPQWQEYKTTDGWMVLLRPELGKVVRLKYYNNLAEPIYWANVQPVFSVKKT